MSGKAIVDAGWSSCRDTEIESEPASNLSTHGPVAPYEGAHNAYYVKLCIIRGLFLLVAVGNH